MTNITAKIIADSVSSVNGKRITTFELEYPRFIHAEFMTHRMISKNSASSRAIPVKAMLENIKSNMAVPAHWGKNQAGMQAKEEHDAEVFPVGVIVAMQATTGKSEAECVEMLKQVEPKSFTAYGAWLSAQVFACQQAEEFANSGYHKQIVNRLTEPFQMIKVVATATEWDNFFWLRKHADAQPEIRILAEKMWEARQASKPEILYPGEWHVPYVKTKRFSSGRKYLNWLNTRELEDGQEESTFEELTLEQALKVSSSMCAQVSYRKADDTLEKAIMVYDRLVESKPVHASPFEHQATPMKYVTAEQTVMAVFHEGVPADKIEKGGIGTTAIHRDLGNMSGNFASWVQHRQLIADNTCWDYENE